MGRPKGSTNKAPRGLSFEQRMKVLAKIIQDPKEKTVNKLSAVKQVTDMLADKVQTINTEDKAITIVKFEQDILTIPQDIVPIPTTIPQPVVVTQCNTNEVSNSVATTYEANVASNVISEEIILTFSVSDISDEVENDENK